MLNRLTSSLDNFSAAEDPAGHVDARPGVRLVWLFALAVLPLALVLARVAQLQILLPEEYAGAFERFTTEVEPIPTRDGRILGTDGRILACDIEHYNVLAHYRWLQEPPDPGWLRQQALSRLSRSERRDTELVALAEQRVREEREAMWRRLAELTGSEPEQLTRERLQIQRRIERMKARVEQQRRNTDAAAINPPEEAGDDGGLAARIWDSLERSLTTPPRRGVRDPLVLKEELDYHPVVSNVPLAVAAEIESHPELYPGLRTTTATERSYPAGSLAPHIIGTRTPIQHEEIAERRARFAGGDPLDYQPGDRIGRTGVERTYDRQLRGLRGVRRIVKDRRGQIVRAEIVREPRMGSDIVLTLNLPLQQQTEQILDEAIAPRAPNAGGSLVVLDVRTGAVVAAASAPRYDLEAYLHATPGDWERITSDPRRPLFHRAVQMTLPPGSTFKTLSAIALLESGRIDPGSPLSCRGYFGENPTRNRCYIFTHYGVGHGETTLSDALCRSCNVYFFDAAERVGAHVLVDWGERFGFGRPTGIDLPGEDPGNLPRPPRTGVRSQESGVRNQRSGFTTDHGLRTTDKAQTPWYPGDTRGLAIGQSRLTVTPLQIARLMAAVANGGRLVTPYVVRGTGPALVGAETSARIAPREPRPIAGLNDETLALVREGLERVVSDPQGTAYKTARLDQIAVAGKTGTAEVGGGRPDHAWFAGYVPAERPRYAFAVVLEHAGSGGTEAGPAARKLVESMLDLGLLQPASEALTQR